MNEEMKISVRTDSETLKQCEELYNDLGMDLSTAINVFMRKSLHVGGFPFSVRYDEDHPNEDTIAAMIETEALLHDPNTKMYTDVEEFLKDLKS